MFVRIKGRVRVWSVSGVDDEDGPVGFSTSTRWRRARRAIKRLSRKRRYGRRFWRWRHNHYHHPDYISATVYIYLYIYICVCVCIYIILLFIYSSWTRTRTRRVTLLLLLLYIKRSQQIFNSSRGWIRDGDAFPRCFANEHLQRRDLKARPLVCVCACAWAKWPRFYAIRLLLLLWEGFFLFFFFIFSCFFSPNLWGITLVPVTVFRIVT